MPLRAFTVPFEDPGNIIDEATEVYGADETDIDELTGEVFACWPVADAGHLFLTGCGVTRCVHCGTVVAV
jgi:hypothetical protein